MHAPMIQEDGQGEQELPGDLQGFRRPVRWNCKCIHTNSRQLGNSDCAHAGLGPELRCPPPGTAENRIGCGEPVLYSNKMYQLQQMDAQKLVVPFDLQLQCCKWRLLAATST